MGDILDLISYYTNGQTKETLTHQYLMLKGNCHACNENNMTWCSCGNEKKKQKKNVSIRGMLCL